MCRANARAGQQRRRSAVPLVGGRVGQKRPRLLGRRNDAGQVEIDAANKIGVAARRRQRTDRRGLDEARRSARAAAAVEMLARDRRANGGREC